jgi:shikimate dehydrogenase
VCGNYLEFNNQRISGKTVVYGLIGDPVDHSISPEIQNAAFRSTGIDAVYVPFHVKRQGLSDAIQGLRALEVKGFNVTAPHKVNVLRYLDKVEISSAAIGAVNTVIYENGKLCGYNTDGAGALKALEEAGASPNGKSILLFGAGGASRAIAYTLAQHVRSVRLVNRTLAKAKQLASRLRGKFNIDVTYASLSSKLLRGFVEQADIVVNASSMGMDGNANPPIEAKWLRLDQCVVDIVYTPLQTRLLELAGSAGAKTIGGLDMLVNQGACSFELWIGRKAPLLEMRRAIAQKLLAMEHAESS